MKSRAIYTKWRKRSNFSLSPSTITGISFWTGNRVSSSSRKKKFQRNSRRSPFPNFFISTPSSTIILKNMLFLANGSTPFHSRQKIESFSYFLVQKKSYFFGLLHFTEWRKFRSLIWSMKYLPLSQPCTLLTKQDSTIEWETQIPRQEKTWSYALSLKLSATTTLVQHNNQIISSKTAMYPKLVRISPATRYRHQL